MRTPSFTEGAGSAHDGAANYHQPDLNAVFALLRQQNNEQERDMLKSEEDYKAQKLGTLDVATIDARARARDREGGREGQRGAE